MGAAFHPRRNKCIIDYESWIPLYCYFKTMMGVNQEKLELAASNIPKSEQYKNN